MNKQEKLPLISIVVPVYNQEKYLAQCLDSLVNQTYKKIEINVVDDGSTDGSSEICQQYASRFSCVKILNQENAGLSAARTLGISASSGQFIMFVDSDDWVDHNICETLYAAMKRYGTSTAMCGYVREYAGKSLPKCIFATDTVLTGKQVERRLCGPIGAEIGQPENMECFNTAWAHLYPSDVLKKIKKVDNALIGPSEDLLSNLYCMANITSMVYVSMPLYHYRKNVSTSETVTYKPRLVEQWNLLYDYMEQYICEHGLEEECVQAFQNRIALSTLGAGLNAVSDGASISTKVDRVRAVLLDTRRKKALGDLKIDSMPLHWKVFYRFAKQGSALPVCLLLILIQHLKGRV